MNAPSRARHTTPAKWSAALWKGSTNANAAFDIDPVQDNPSSLPILLDQGSMFLSHNVRFSWIPHMVVGSCNVSIWTKQDTTLGTPSMIPSSFDKTAKSGRIDGRLRVGFHSCHDVDICCSLASKE